MACNSCSRTTLRLFIEAVTNTKPLYIPRTTPLRQFQTSQFSSVVRSQNAQKTSSGPPKPPRNASSSPKAGKPSKDGKPVKDKSKTTFLPRIKKEEKVEFKRPEKEPEPWMLQKKAVKEKLGGATWNPRKRLSPDTMDGIRHLNSTQPEKFTTPVLAKHFEVSPEAIRRILKSKWRPSTEDEEEDRLRRWDKRGELIWSNLVEMGVKPPKKWREMGVGKAEPGKKPRWKSDTRNQVPVNDGWKDYKAAGGFEDELIPIVDGKTGESLQQKQWSSLSSRL